MVAHANPYKECGDPLLWVGNVTGAPSFAGASVIV